MERRLDACDTIIYLDFGRFACLWGLCQRLMQSWSNTRPDMAVSCPERFDWEFVKWIWSFNKTNRVRNYTLIAKSKHAKAIVLKNRREVWDFLEGL